MRAPDVKECDEGPPSCMLADVSPRLRLLVAVVAGVGLAFIGCGAANEGTIDGTGGEVCTVDRHVCISVPPLALNTPLDLRISPGDEGPGGNLSPVWDISPRSPVDGGVHFQKPAKVSFSLESVDAAGLPDELLLRLFTLDQGEWVPLGNQAVDRVRGVVSGEVRHLSPFVVVRADRLIDGGMPIQLDGGQIDSGMYLPPFDAGSLRDAGTGRDAGTADAGRDAGQVDAGSADSGTTDAGVDAGTTDAGSPDAGPVDAGADAGSADAGQADAGSSDAGGDAGAPDSGAPDAGSRDSGVEDAGMTDAGADGGASDAGDAG